MRSFRYAIAASVLAACSVGAAPAPWHHDLAQAGSGYWRTRVAVTVSNSTGTDAEGRPVEIRVGTKPGELPLVGRDVVALRVFNAKGGELLYDLVAANGEPKRTGALAAGDRLVFGVACKTGAKAVSYVYADNPEAGAVAEFLGATRPFQNGGFEQGADDSPTSWREVDTDAAHRMTWSTESPHSGKRCARCDVDEGATPNWVKYIQEGIHVLPNADYRLEAWVKAKGAKGTVGWFIHVHGDKPMVLNNMAKMGDGTYDWRKATIEFHTPPDAVRLTIGTVLRGTGTAWFDDATLTLLTAKGAPLRAVAGTAETHGLATAPVAGDWRVAPATHRVELKVRNWTDARVTPLVHADLAPVVRRLPRDLRDGRIRIVDPATGSEVPAAKVERRLIFAADAPPKTERVYHAYFHKPSRLPDARKAADMSYPDLVASKANLVANASFEDGGPMPAQWTASDQSDRPADELYRASTDTNAHSGKRCAKLIIPPKAPLAWSGWHQDVQVKPNTTYLYAATLRCKDVDGRVQLHGHYHKADGTHSDVTMFFGIGPGIAETQDWTLILGTVTTPPDCTLVKLHLTVNAHGTVWHDDVFFGEASAAVVGATQPRRALSDRAAQHRGYTAWLVNPVVKVFPDDPPGEPATRITLAAARNETEPFQLVLRSARDLEDVAIDIDLPHNRNGDALALDLNLVGYVPMDHPSSYYRVDVPAWHRKRPPANRTGCDGWAGPWPDPLAPYKPFALKANAAQPVWATLRVPADAKPGPYRGTLTVRPANAPPMTLALEVTVRNFALPTTSHLRVIYDLREGFTRQFGGATGTRQDVLKKWYKFMADHRVCPGILPAPKFSYADGKVTMDTTDFDWAASYCLDDLGMNVFYTPWFFYSFGWAHKPRRIFGLEPLTKEYIEVYGKCLKLYLAHLRKKGWYDKVILYVSDEPHFRHEHIRKQMIAVCKMIQAAWPDARIYSSTWRHCPEWNGSITVWGFGPQGTTPVDVMRERQKAGDTLWFTTDGQMCTDTPYCAIERLLPWFCWKYGVEAYEFWGVNWYTYDPWQFGWHRFIRQSSDGETYFHVRYPNGDGYLAYPGKAVGVDGPVGSIRLAQAREGVEDYEYFHLLDRLIAQAKAKGIDTRAAESVRAEAMALVSIPNRGGRYSTALLPDPDAVPRLRTAIAGAIEHLARKLR